MPGTTVANPGRVHTGDRNAITPYHDKRIQAALSTQILIKAQGYDGNWYDIGGIQSFQVTESRNINPVQEVGTDGIVQLHPSGAQPIQIQVSRAIFDYKRVTAAFQRSFHHVMNQRIPFDIVVVDYNPYNFASTTRSLDRDRALNFNDNDTERTIRTRFVNCWFASNSYSYQAENYQIVESATLTAEAVYDTNMDGVQIAESGQDEVESTHDRTWLSSVMTESYVNIGALAGSPGAQGVG